MKHHIHSGDWVPNGRGIVALGAENQPLPDERAVDVNRSRMDALLDASPPDRTPWRMN